MQVFAFDLNNNGNTSEIWEILRNLKVTTSATLKTAYMSFLQCPEAHGQNMRPTCLVIYIEVEYEYCAICKRNFWFF